MDGRQLSCSVGVGVDSIDRWKRVRFSQLELEPTEEPREMFLMRCSLELKHDVIASDNPLGKICRRCGERLSFASFHSVKMNPDKLSYACRICRHNAHVEDWKTNSEWRCFVSRNTASKNRERNRLSSREYHRKHRTKILARQKANRANKRSQRAAYMRARRANDPQTKLSENIRRRIHDAINGLSRSAKTRSLIGCSFSDLRAHLEAQFTDGMTWENYGPVWHVDHRRPCASFDLTKTEQQHECFHFTNLQPMFASDNVRKSATYTDPVTGITTLFRKTGNKYMTAIT